MIAIDPITTCKVCPQQFSRRNSMQTVCGPRCALKLVRQQNREKKAAEAVERKATRAQLEALKPRAKWLREAQDAFNAYIRARDFDERCISCGKLAAAWGSWDAGHYLTVGARPELRFNEDNVHRQCVRCNQHLHGNLVLYRIGLIARRGLAVVEALEGPHPPAKYTVDDLRRIRDTYRAKARELAKQLKEKH